MCYLLTAPEKVNDVTVTTETNVTKPRTIYVKWSEFKERQKNGIILNFTIAINDNVVCDFSCHI